VTGLSDTIRGFGAAPAAAFDLLQQAAALRDLSGSWDESRLGAHDAHADAVITGAAALLCFAPEHGDRVTDAFRIAVGANDTEGLQRDARHEAVLARVVYGTALSVLHLGGVSALAALRGVDLDGEPLLGTDALRFARHHDGDANVAFGAVSKWISGRPWLDDLPGLDEALVPVALAEVDLLLACLTVTRMDRSESYSAGGGAQARSAPRRLSARLRQPNERAGLALLLGTTDDELNAVLAAADKAIRSHSDRGMPVRRALIVE